MVAEWDGQCWAPQLARASGRPAGLCYDPLQARCFAVIVGAPHMLCEYDGRALTPLAAVPSPQAPMAVVADTARGVIVVLSQPGTQVQVDEWHGTSWGASTLVSGFGRLQAAAFDEATGVTVVIDANGPTTRTWEWNGAAMQLRNS